MLPTKIKCIQKGIGGIRQLARKRHMGEGAITEEVVLSYFPMWGKRFAVSLNADKVFNAKVNIESTQSIVNLLHI